MKNIIAMILVVVLVCSFGGCKAQLEKQLDAGMDELERKAIEKVEEMISRLAEESGVQEKTADLIRQIRQELDKLPKPVREKIGNLDLLEQAEQAIEAEKAASGS